MKATTGLVSTLLSLPVFEAEWVLWLLLALSFASVAIMIERAVFFRRHRVDAEAVRIELSRLLAARDFAKAAAYLKQFDSFETNVVLFGLRDYEKGVGSVEELLSGAQTRERMRYSERLSFLATVGSNAPFIGLFGTVLGIIRAFRDLSGNMSDASASVMGGISEALVATAVGLIVAIPAVVAYNLFTNRVKRIQANGVLLEKTLLSELKAKI